MHYKALGFSILTAASITAAINAMTTSADALTFTETSDVGQSLTNAVDTSSIGVVGNNPIENLTTIRGTLVGTADLFKIVVTTGFFTASTRYEDVGIDETVIDTQLFLFDANGKGIVANDDFDFLTTRRSRIKAQLAAGTYYLGITKFNYDPRDRFDNSIFSDAFSGLVPVNPQAGALDNWRGTVFNQPGKTEQEVDTSRTYEIALGIQPVPTPALIPGLVTLFLAVKRKHQTTPKDSDF
ncbi:MAG TPA: DVUA0089 family protein [Leptolyngbyaceae cyanobacterium M33_DOE_097]|uniref:PTPA-CTERM sorting domain-containing protein n=1 Tax=Oscillatoriales cyanobacterium SpSt-418 TaxID=2282169 RepID=A0A7C3KDM4_9CYAN|nr:DVUA0089 family protein [Leptolyngbyaceae cyanobacterium M33_DOE_097]